MTRDNLGWHKAGYGHELYDADRQVAFATSMNGLRGRQFYWRLTEAGRRHLDGTCSTLRAAKKEAVEAYTAPFQETRDELLRDPEFARAYLAPEGSKQQGVNNE
jgi:hypothetical protein